MDALIAFLSAYLQDEELLRRAVVIIVAMTIFVMAIGTTVLILGVTDPVRRRLGVLAGDEKQSRGVAIKIATAVGPVGAFVLPKEELERNKVQRDLFRAGYRSGQGLQIFYATKTLLIVLFPVIVLIGSQFFPNLDTQAVMYYCLIGAGVGMLVPNYWLDKKVARRIRLLRNGFPDALDLLVVCVEAGLGLGPALQRVSEELSVSHPELSFELANVTAEMRAGIPREQALKNLADRTGLSDIRGLVALLVQSMRFGTSVAETLRVYSEEFRDRRMQAAEEQAAKLATKMIFPLILCMFPVFFIVAVGPAVLKIIEAFAGISGG